MVLYWPVSCWSHPIGAHPQRTITAGQHLRIHLRSNNALNSSPAAVAGIGLATAERFSRRRLDRRRVRRRRRRPLPRSRPTTPSGITGTLTCATRSSGPGLEEFTSHTGGTPDVLDNNAGILVAGLLVDISAETPSAARSRSTPRCRAGAQVAHPYLKRTPAHIW